MSHHAAVMHKFHENGAIRCIFAGSGKVPSHSCSNGMELDSWHKTDVTLWFDS